MNITGLKRHSKLTGAGEPDGAALPNTARRPSQSLDGVGVTLHG